jgi:hypothetical protein
VTDKRYKKKKERKRVETREKEQTIERGEKES